MGELRDTSATPAGFALNAFAGTAEHYLRYRLPYPCALFEDLLARVGAIEAGRVLDLGCGPGRIALNLAPRFRDAWALDVEPEMVEVGRAEAVRRGISNVHWIVAAAETTDLPVGSFDLITIGEAFHRFQQRQTVQCILKWLRPGGALAIIGGEGAINGIADWQREAQAVVRRFTDRPSPSGPTPTEGIEEDGALLRIAGFTDVASYDFTVEHEWTKEAVVGHLYSTSYCSKAALGGRASLFEAELTAALLATDPAGRYRQLVRFGYTFARKPEGRR
jgi:SAM-dependent methyltransferase